MGKYQIKCDDCKKSLGTTDSIPISASGGRCSTCKKNGGIRF